MMNVLENKKKAMCQAQLHTSLQRQMDAVSNIKPSLDGLSSINNTMVEKPFMNMATLSLTQADNKIENIMNKNNIANQQVNDLKKEVLHSSNIAQVVEMNLNDNNKIVSGNIKKIEAKSNDGKNFKVQEEVIELPENKKIINSFNINLNDDSIVWEKNTKSNLNNNKLDERINQIINQNKNNKKLVGKKNNSTNNNENKSAGLVAYQEMMKKMRITKTMLFVFMLAVLLVFFFVKGNKKK